MLIELLTKKYPGMRLWLTQRISAAYMATYCIWLLILLVIEQPASHLDWVDIFTPVWWKGLTFLFFISLFTHAWLGVRDVLKDYVFNLTTRAWLQLIVDIVLIGYMVWVTIILWQV